MVYRDLTETLIEMYKSSGLLVVSLVSLFIENMQLHSKLAFDIDNSSGCIVKSVHKKGLVQLHADIFGFVSFKNANLS